MSDLPPDVSYDGRHILYSSIQLAFESLFYGIYAVLVPFSAYIMLKKGIKSRLKLLLFSAIFVPFILSTLYIAVEFAIHSVLVETFIIHRAKRNLPNIANYSTLFNALVLINYVFTDAVVVWRAWALCKEDYSRILFFPIAFLTFTILSVLGVIGVRIATFFFHGTPAPLTTAINVLQVSGMAFSLLSNVTATAIISHKAWSHRVVIKAGLANVRDRSTRIERILVLIIESGIIYCVSGVLFLVGTFIRLPYGTLGDIYSRINTQVSGIYPTIIIVLVNLERSVNNTTYWQPTTVQQSVPQNNHSTSMVHPRFSRIHFNNDSALYDGPREAGSKSESHLVQHTVFEERHTDKAESIYSHLLA